jgi:3-hydroxyisobutyrate dehydrogenase
MGARMASRLLADGISLAVWSRSGLPPGCSGLESQLVPEARVAVQKADVVFVMVTDDDASRAVWLDSGALASMRRGAVAVDCSTLTPTWVRKLAQHAAHAGVAFIDAPVVGSRPQADAGNLIFLAGGDAGIIEALRPILLRLGSTVHHLGASPAGTLTKLLVNSLLATQVALLAELVAVARRGGLELTALAQAFDGLSVTSASARAALAGMVAGSFAPMFPLSLAAKDLRYAVAEAGMELPITKAVSDVFERGLAQGLSAENLTAVAKLYARDSLMP